MTTAVPEKKGYEVAVEEFEAVDQVYQAMLNKMMSGDLVVELASSGLSADQVREQFLYFVGMLQNTLVDRNAKLDTAKAAMRDAVVLGPTQERGPDGKPTSVEFHGFSVTSATRRGFHADDLFNGVRKHGLYERLMELESRDKDGKKYKLVQQTWKIDYKKVKDWLEAHQLGDVLNGAYQEKEGTPLAKGPKPLVFVGEAKEVKVFGDDN